MSLAPIQQRDEMLIECQPTAIVSKCSIYRQIADIRGIKCQHLNASRLALQLSLRNILKPAVKSRMTM